MSKPIRINGFQDFPCPLGKGWTVEKAENRIRSAYPSLIGGYIVNNDIATDAADVIEENGNYELVNFQIAQSPPLQTCATGAGGTAGPPLPPHPPSPRLLHCIFVLCDDNLNACGTAFAISENCVLTAYHNIATDPAKPTRSHIKSWKIVNGLERLSDGSIRTIEKFVPIAVTVHKYSYSADWVILKRNGGLFDANNEVVPICSATDIPVYGEEPDVKIYQCAVEIFNTGFINAIRPTSLTVKMGFCSGHKVFLQAGLFGGSSGAVYVIADFRHRGFGKAFGMHCESINTARTISDVENEGIINDPDAIIEEVTDSCVNSHASFVEGILISKYSTLMNSIF